ncbi:hypothetical protein [Micromonospora sp. bgisy143]|uniref:hypothetical protein n=1 Tax=Micromonospora sp. bgisy143 TaxID=3413790 RepID=UPI003EBC99BD
MQLAAPSAAGFQAAAKIGEFGGVVPCGGLGKAVPDRAFGEDVDGAVHGGAAELGRARNCSGQLRSWRVEYSLGWSIGETDRAAIGAVPTAGGTAAPNADGATCDSGQVASCSA